ncbi:serine/threonine-protein phosphatase [Rathayibacter caricis]|uniref:PP2C family protein-serine/threonine phosphatase n=1 Tax=Rathayibacter caricis TaxID=110936 RepID=UPI001FB3B3D1|nr:PP2C family protein-serine/threonine phosphatase [Rathayibacter caricis]MCJ1697275.1 serine/threonine-protein phosphatase [Rathayibacter caricis]
MRPVLTRRRVRELPPVDSLALTANGFDEQTPLVKQLPVLGLFLVAVALSVSVPTLVVTSATALIAAVLMMVAATALAAVMPRTDALGRVALVIPAIDFLAVGVLRFATGESASIFASLAVLPTVWVAAGPGRRHIALASLGVVAGLVLPFLLGSTLEENPNELARGVFSAGAFGLAALVVNELSRMARERVADISAREKLTHLELTQASAVQQALLPKERAELHGYAFAGVCLPSRAIGGDFFDWYDIQGGAAFTVGDVMGKGVGAGIIAATVRAVVRSARNHDDLAVAASRASESLASDLGDTASFATMFHARLDETTGVVRYLDAGHGLTLHVHADGTWDRLASHNLPVGIGEDAWATAELVLLPGDSLVSCSDGILDLYDGRVESLRHVAALVSQSTDAADAVARISARAEGGANDDDVTVLVLRRAV